MTGDLPRLRALAVFVHDATCPRRGAHAAQTCPSVLREAPARSLLAALDAAPRDARGARLVLHDIYCVSGGSCSQRDAHAQRNADTVAAARRFRTTEENA